MRHPLPNPIGLSVIDLFSCAFIALFVLNLLSEDDPGAEQTKKQGLDFISAQLDETSRLKGLTVGMKFELEGKTYSSWDLDSSIVWVPEPGRITATNLPDAITPHTAVTVVIQDAPWITANPSVSCNVSTSSGLSPEILVLDASHHWSGQATTP